MRLFYGDACYNELSNSFLQDVPAEQPDKSVIMPAVEPVDMQADNSKREKESVPNNDRAYPDAATASNILDDSVKDKIFEVESSSLEKDIESAISTYEKNQLIAKQKEALDKVGYNFIKYSSINITLLFLCNNQFLHP